MSTPVIRGTTVAGVGVTYIPVDRFQAETTIQCIANGTITYTVDGTGDVILYDTATLAAANILGRAGAVVPASAAWDEIIASGSASADNSTSRRFRALRINQTAGTGTVTFTINQGGGG